MLNDFEGATGDGDLVRGRDGILNNPAEPILPLELRNVTLDQTVLRGVGFRAASTKTRGIIPLTGAATTEIRGCMSASRPSVLPGAAVGSELL